MPGPHVVLGIPRTCMLLRSKEDFGCQHTDCKIIFLVKDHHNKMETKSTYEGNIKCEFANIVLAIIIAVWRPG